MAAILPKHEKGPTCVEPDKEFGLFYDDCQAVIRIENRKLSLKNRFCAYRTVFNLKIINGSVRRDIRWSCETVK